MSRTKLREGYACVFSSLLPLALALLVSPVARADAACDGLEREVLASLRARQFLEAHLLAKTATALCPSGARLPIYDALSLLELDDSARARERLEAARGEPAAGVLWAWSFLRDRDDAAFAAALDRLPEPPRLRLRFLAAAADPDAALPPLDLARPETQARLDLTVRRLRAAQHTKRPWLAGTLSAVVPGAGQAYAGSWQAAGVAFAVNAILIGATVELAWRRHYVTAGAAGLAASFFYVGNVVNAVDLARRRNEMAAGGPRLELERQVLPEAHP